MEDTVGAVVERAKAGDVEAWQHLVRRHLGMVRAVCAAYGLDERDAVDVNQVVWLRLAEHLPRIRTPDAIGGWIAATTRGECLAPRRDPGSPGSPGSAGSNRAAGSNGSNGSAELGGSLGAAGFDRSAGANGSAGSVGVLGANGSAGSAASVGVLGAAGSDDSVEGDLAAAFGRMGGRCQRLLRLLATEPRPADQDVSAALDIPLEQVPAECAGCLDRLCRLLSRGDRPTSPPTVWAGLRRLAGATTDVPPSWWSAAHTAFAWLVLDVRSAELVYDSTAPPVTLVHAGRAAGRLPIRQLRFSLGRDRVELALDTRDGELALSGQLTPARTAHVTAHWPGGRQSAGSDDDGAFRLDNLPVAPLCVQVDGANPFKTGWIVP